ncbi:polysaccharide biosynthesis tyrosine autokinase [Microbacterium sp. F51-2R]|uniref:polysaccharide biosynthesis tyrosine autokinase n=1 Tax=Microbacterium sp. F51-2R TaxID=3445777 RepID=UPI003F9ED380
MELRDYTRGLRRHWLAIVLMVLVGIGVSFLWVKLQTPVYEAGASGFVRSQSASSESLTGGMDPAAQSKVASYLDIAGWRDVAEYVIDDLKLDTTPEELVTRVNVSNPEGTVILKILAQGPQPIAARQLAESWIRGMAATIDKFEGDGTPGSAPVNIVPGDSASLPSSPLFPDLRTSLVVGAVIGLGFGIGFALMRTASDRRVRTAKDIEDKTEVAVVGTIPLSKQSDPEARLFDPETGRGGPGFAVAEAMRSLRTNLQFMDVDNPPKKIVVTSPLPGDGKSTIACNLALTLAASGSYVTLVDGDLRRSKVADTMGVTSGAGLSDVLAGRATLVDVLQRSPQSPNLYVLAAGGAPPNPSEVLGSARMRAVLDELAEYSTVIIDAPPLIPVTDGAVLTHQADGALLVVSLGKTTYDLIEKALDLLQKARGRALGIVLNKAPLKGVDASPYSYEYRRHYGAATSADVSARTTPAEADIPGPVPADDVSFPPASAAAPVKAAAPVEAATLEAESTESAPARPGGSRPAMSDEAPARAATPSGAETPSRTEVPTPGAEPADEVATDDSLDALQVLLSDEAVPTPAEDEPSSPRRHRARRA